MTDLLLRGRGANVGARAPVWLLRLCGAALAFALYLLADFLGLWSVLGVSPTLVRFSMLALGALLAPTRAGSLLWAAAGLLTAVSCLVLYTPIVRPFALALVRRDADTPRASAAGAFPDAVAVLSGGMTDDGRVTGPALDRLLTGIALARSRQIPFLLLSVIDDERGGQRFTSEADQRALVAALAPELDVRMVRDVHSTRDEALAFAAVARTRGWTRVQLVTSPAHTRRACAAVEAAGLAVQCTPSVARDYSLARLDLSENRRRAFADVLYEGSAQLLYSSRGWLKQ